ncbi:hypothetical protein FOA52_006166 [Chlamydomonas sp. UWO 241]|nr:hypothetical protein FOA52_006166 [Chlamydomonas sp. UWO 241]
MPIAKSSVAAKVAGNSLKVGPYTWAYRRTEVPTEVAMKDTPVLLLHGLGSSSFCYRTTLGLLGAEGYDAIAPDWVGHGDSDKPAGFACTEAAYTEQLAQFIEASGIKKPFALVVHGFVLGQFALRYAQENPAQIERLMVLNTPLARNSKLRPELAAYKNPLPFMRPGSKTFDAANYSAGGSPYAMSFTDAQVYAKPYLESPVASEIISKTMDKLDFKKLAEAVDDGFYTWRVPTALCFGSSDAFIDLFSVFDFLESKRTNMKALTFSGKVGHMPQEDYPEQLHTNLMLWLTGSMEDWTTAQSKSLKMSKKGAVDGAPGGKVSRR